MATPLVDLSLSQIRCFVAVVECGSFAKAGRSIGMSTSAVSKTIARFEQAYGLKLLHRSTHSLSLTEEGEQLIEPARQTVGVLGSLEASLDEVISNGGIGRVRLIAPVAFARSWIVPLLPEFAAELPDVHLDMRVSNEVIDLAQAGADLAIRGGSLDMTPGHSARPWFKYPWVACAAADYVARRGMPRSPDDLAHHDLIGFRNQSSGAIKPWRFKGDGETSSRPPLNPRFSIDDGETAWSAALTGVGIVMAPLWLACEALEDGRMVEVLGDWREEETQVSLLRRDRRHAPKRVESVIDFLRAHTPKFPAEYYADA